MSVKGKEKVVETINIVSENEDEAPNPFERKRKRPIARPRERPLTSPLWTMLMRQRHL